MSRLRTNGDSSESAKDTASTGSPESVQLKHRKKKAKLRKRTHQIENIIRTNGDSSESAKDTDSLGSPKTVRSKHRKGKAKRRERTHQTVEEFKGTNEALIKETALETKKTNFAVDKNEASSKSSPMYDQTRDKELQEIKEVNKVLMEKLVKDLIILIFRKNKMSFIKSTFEAHQEWLFGRLWTEAEEIHCHITPEKFNNLHHVLFSDLCNFQRLQVSIVTSLEMKDPLFGSFIALRFRRYMIKRPTVWKRITCKMTKSNKVDPLQRIPLQRHPSEKVTLKKVPVKNTVNPQDQSVEDFPTVDCLRTVGTQVDDKQTQNEAKCHLLLNQYLTEIIPCVFFRGHTDCSYENFTNLYQRLHSKLWELCKSYDFETRTANIDKLCAKTVKELRTRVCQPQYILLKGLNLQDPVSDVVVLHVFEKHMLKKKSKVAQFFSSVARFIVRPFIKTRVFDTEGLLL